MWRHWVSTALVFVTIIFIFAGFGTVNGEVGWAKYEANGIKTRYGLLKQRTDSGGSTTTTDYDGDSCNSDYCTKCHSVGEGVITLAVFALFASLAAGAFIVMRMRGDNEQWRLGALVCLGSVILLAFLVEAIWPGQCYEALRDHFDSNKDKLELEAGFGLGFMVIVFTVIAAINEACISVGAGESGEPLAEA